MKTKYLVITGITGIVGITAAIFYFRSRKRLNGLKSKSGSGNQTADAEKHIRSVMKKSKPAQ